MFTHPKSTFWEDHISEAISDNFSYDRKYLWNGFIKNRKRNLSTTTLPTLQEKMVKFGPLTKKV